MNSSTRTISLVIAAVVVAAVVLAVAGGVIPVGNSSHPRPRPNIVLLSIDTLRADHLGCYGYSRPTSPTIDELASQGVLFERAFSHSPKTAISHMSILTGLLPPAHGVTQNDDPEPQRLSDSIPTIATLLRQAGYATFAVTGGGHVSANLGFDQGMDWFTVDGAFSDATGHVLAGIKKVREQQPGKPFFAFLHTYAVHDPYTPPIKFQKLFVDPAYDGKIISTYQDLVRASGDSGWQTMHEVYWRHVDPNDLRDVQHIRDLYDGGIRTADAEVAKLVQRLREMEVWDNTLFILLSDHGEEFQEHGKFLHEQLFQEHLHVPMIWLFPRDEQGNLRNRREPGVVRLIDVLPTLLDYLGLETPRHAQGLSLWHYLKGHGALPPPIVMSSWKTAGLEALRQGDLKLMRDSFGRKRRLFDLSADPSEKTDVWDKRADVGARYEAELQRIKSDGAAFLASHRAGKAAAPDQETLERLRALGYAKDQ